MSLGLMEMLLLGLVCLAPVALVLVVVLVVVLGRKRDEPRD